MPVDGKHWVHYRPDISIYQNLEKMYREFVFKNNNHALVNGLLFMCAKTVLQTVDLCRRFLDFRIAFNSKSSTSTTTKLVIYII